MSASKKHRISLGALGVGLNIQYMNEMRTVLMRQRNRKAKWNIR